MPFSFTLTSLLRSFRETCVAIDGDVSISSRYRRENLYRFLLYVIILGTGILITGCADGRNDIFLKADCEHLTLSENEESGAGLGSVQLKATRGIGVGASQGVAIMNALTNAINQLSDTNISFVRPISVLAEELDNTVNPKKFDMSLVSNFVESATDSGVPAFCVSSLRQSWDSNNQKYIWSAEAVMQISFYDTQLDTTIPRIMIADVRVVDSQYNVGDRLVSADYFASQLVRDLRSKILASSDYVLVDRMYTDEIDGEQALIISGKVNPRELARIGQLSPADIIVIPEIISLDYSVRIQALRTSGRTLRWYDGRMDLSFLVINLITGEIMNEKTISKDFPSTEPTTLDIRIDPMLIVSNAISEAVIEFVYDLLLSADVIYVVSIEASRVTVSNGENSLSIGDRLIAYGLGENIFHPITQEFLGKEEVIIGEVIIDQVTEQLSYGTIILKQKHEDTIDSFELIRLEIISEGDAGL